MKLFLPTLFLSLVALAGNAQKHIAITNVNIIPMTSATVLQNKTVIIENGRIARIGDAGKIKAPANATVINANGKYLLPGFFRYARSFLL